MTELFVPDSDKATALTEKIALEYLDVKRFYHNQSHLEHFGQEISEIEHLLTPEELAVIAWAILFHDYVYDLKSRHNEVESAIAAQDELSLLDYSDDFIKKVMELIMETANHGKIIAGEYPSYNRQEVIDFFLDADMSILGQKPAAYRLYCDAIKAEYRIAQVCTLKEYNQGRKTFLTNTLDGGKIYKSEYFRKKYEAQACFNIKKELNAYS